MTIRQDALEAVKTPIRAADPEAFVRDNVRRHGSEIVVSRIKVDLSRFDRILVIGGGKAGLGMAFGIERLLGARITGGLVNIPDNLRLKSWNHKVRFNPASHPLPSSRGVLGVQTMLRLVGRPSTSDLVICLISGGASALMPVPLAGLSLREKQEVTRQLLSSGASVDEVNTVRRHLSAVKGGRLAERLYPATVLCLIISDVAGDRLEDVGSGPTAPDPSTYSDARKVLEAYRLWGSIPKSARDIIRKGMAGSLSETPKPGSKAFRRVHNVIIGSNGKPCAAAAEGLSKVGYRTLLLTRRLNGEARHVGQVLSSILSDLDHGRFSLKRPFALVAGGETTVDVKGKGTGGRNQELVLAAALGIRRLSDVVIASVGTDGLDGPTQAAGAIADGTTFTRALERGLDPRKFLENNDSHNFFKKLGDLIVTGPTGTNVGDVTISLAGPPLRGRSRPGR